MDTKQLLIGNEAFINSVDNFTSNKKIQFNPELAKILDLNKNSINNIIKDVIDNSQLFVENINALGNSSYQILKTINELKNKNVTLCIINKDLILHLKNDLLFKFITSLLEFENEKINIRTQIAKDTREKRNTALGRKAGQKIKSKYEQYKRRIMYLHKKGVPNTKIVKEIDTGTAQSLGKYIKQLKLEEKRKQKKKAKYLLNENDIKDINKNFGTVK